MNRARVGKDWRRTRRFVGCLVAGGLALGAVGPGTPTAHGELVQPGDLAFVGWNVDGDDDLAFALFADTSPGTTVWFTDNEWQGTAWNTGEGVMQWASNAVLAAGTVVVLRDIDAAGNPLRGASHGTLSGSLQLATTGETVYAYLGATSSTPSTFLGAISTRAGDYSGSGGTLAGTGLSAGSTAVLLAANSRGGQYAGSRTDRNSFAEYLPRIGNAAQWSSQTTDGELALPFDSTPFTLQTSAAQTTATPEPSTLLLTLTLVGGCGGAHYLAGGTRFSRSRIWARSRATS